MSDTAYTPQVPIDPGMYAAQADRERVDREAPFMEASRGLALSEAFSDAQLTERLGGWLDADGQRAFDRQRQRVFGADVGAPLSAEEATERFGVEGRLKFDQPISEAMAAWRQTIHQREAFRDEVISNAEVGALELMGAGIAGSILDPAGLPLWLVPELATGRALRGAATASRLARMGSVSRGALTGGLEGIAGGLAFEGANLWLHHEAATDYDLGDAAANVVFGGLLGAAIGGTGGWWEGRTRGRAPVVVEQLSDNGRAGAFAEALDAVVEDRPVNLAPMLAQEARLREAGRLPVEQAAQMADTAAMEGGVAMRGVDDRFGATAVTPRGREVPVRFALVEAEDLITSHDDDLFRNVDYPEVLQPRQRDRAGAQARNRMLEAELNPRRLISEAGAETGAPIISADGVVESGNGRTIALRRSARSGSPAFVRYRAELEARGLDVSGMEAPVLVRVRQEALSGEDRVRLTREMNAEATEAYSPSERASADAEALDDALMDMIEGSDLNGAANRRFVRGFLERVAGDDLNRMTTGDGRLSEAGLDRISAALTARAYGDRALVEALFEATDNNIKAIGRALAAAAPEWAAMRAGIARGEVPAELDPTEALTAAVAFVRHVRQRGANLAETMDLTIGQFDAFNGAAMTPETEGFVRSFFRTSAEGATLWRSPRSAASLADGLRWMAGEIRKADPGPNLFGEVADAATGRQLLDGLGRWFARTGDDGPPPGLDFGPEPGSSGAASPSGAGGDVRPDGGDDGRVVGGQNSRDEAARDLGETAKPKVAKGQKPAPPKGDPYADPEVAALRADTEAALLRAGVDPAELMTGGGAAQDPETIADAVAAGAFCLKGGV
ncbi:hypothetical protein [Brevundimonas sp.]|uniref:hypothetical protein n=1 Tax=Brevundimonas sp. TaxID=1871086 RepID=UPI00289F1FAB|nr:hypothetical protein [Brevundimonas sp.]